MDDLIEALTILRKYCKDPKTHSPTNCEHDVLAVVCVPEDAVSTEDILRLDELGFFWSEECWISFRFGSA